MIKIIKLLLLFSVASFFVSCTNGSKEEDTEKVHDKTHVYYTCSMHPSIKEDKPGKCPICHMNLTKVEVDLDMNESESEKLKLSSIAPKEIWQCRDFPDVTSEVEDICPMDGSKMIKKKMNPMASKIVAKVKLRKAQLDHFKADLFPVTKMKMIKKIRLLGSVSQSEEKESNIPARIGGRVEKVYVKSKGSIVKIGDPVVDIYSPRLITAGEEYLLAKKSYKKNKSKEFKSMLDQSIERLRLWGIEKSQYEKWFLNKKVPKNITIFSNTTGIVRSKNAVTGKYFKEGQNFFELSDLSDVWVDIDVYESDSSLVNLGQKIDLSFSALPGESITGEIDFVSPVLDKKSRSLKVRTTIKNKGGKLKPGMIASAVLNIEIKGEPLVIPRSAVIDTGERKVVWTQVNSKKYQARIIQTGYESGGYVEVKGGVIEGEKVVIEGSFLLDAQAQLFGGYEDINKNSMQHNH